MKTASVTEIDEIINLNLQPSDKDEISTNKI